MNRTGPPCVRPACAGDARRLLEIRRRAVERVPLLFEPELPHDCSDADLFEAFHAFQAGLRIVVLERPGRGVFGWFEYDDPPAQGLSHFQGWAEVLSPADREALNRGLWETVVEALHGERTGFTATVSAREEALQEALLLAGFRIEGARSACSAGIDENVLLALRLEGSDLEKAPARWLFGEDP